MLYGRSAQGRQSVGLRRDIAEARMDPLTGLVIKQVGGFKSCVRDSAQSSCPVFSGQSGLNNGKRDGVDT